MADKPLVPSIGRGLAAAATMLLLAAGSPPMAELDVGIAGLRSAKGDVIACLTRDPRYFPDCTGDPHALTARIAAGQHVLRFGGVPPGDYALSLVHDENGNGKLDTRLGIPREGIAFSRNPRLMFGPPSFGAVQFSVAGGTTGQAVTMKYFL